MFAGTLSFLSMMFFNGFAYMIEWGVAPAFFLFCFMLRKVPEAFDENPIGSIIMLATTWILSFGLLSISGDFKGILYMFYAFLIFISVFFRFTITMLSPIALSIVVLIIKH